MYLTSWENFRTPGRVHGVSKATGGPPGVIINPVAILHWWRGAPATTKIPSATRRQACADRPPLSAPAASAAHHVAAGTGGDHIGLCPHVPAQSQKGGCHGQMRDVRKRFPALIAVFIGLFSG